MRSARVVVVDADSDSRRSLTDAVVFNGRTVLPFESPREALATLQSDGADLVLADVAGGGESGFEFLEEVRRIHPALPFVAIVDSSESEAAIRAVRMGADDFIVRPVSHEIVQRRVGRLLDTARLRLRVEELELDRIAPEIVAASPEIVGILEKLPVIAESGAPVLLTGESGTGKEVMARAIHRLSPRRGHPFLPVNCAAIPENLLESELFGHRKGAFTGADRDRAGMFVEAAGGTLFLDEVGELPPALQAKLLRAIEAREIRPVGSSKPVPIDARIVSATNANLGDAIATGRFRLDLYYRLSMVTLRIPPLRERRDDITALAENFLRDLAGQTERPNLRFTPEGLARLEADPWPGNVRQLRNRIFRAVLFSRGDQIGPDDLAPANPLPGPPDGGEAPMTPDWETARSEFERKFLVSGLRRCRGNVTRLSSESGLARRTLYKLLSRHALDPARFRGRTPDEPPGA